MAPRSLRSLAWITAAGLLLVLIMGSLVTDTGSGRGCGGTWPLCHGRLLPEYTVQSLIEYSHRAVAGTVGVLVAVLSVWAWRACGRDAHVRFLAAAGALFVVVQALLGGADVLWPEAAPVLALHFGFSLLAFSGVALLAIALRQLPRGTATQGAHPAPRAFGPLAWATFAYTYGLVYLGAYVAHSHAALACLGWPLCNGQLLPPLRGAVGVNFAHRLGALAAFVLVALLFAQARPRRRQRPDLYRGSRLALALAALQALSGAYLVLSRLSLAAMLLHGTLASLLFATLAYLCLAARSEPAGAGPGPLKEGRAALG